MGTLPRPPSTQLGVTLIMLFAAVTFCASYVGLHPGHVVQRLTTSRPPYLPATAPLPPLSNASHTHACRASAALNASDHDSPYAHLLDGTNATFPVHRVFLTYARWHARHRACLTATRRFCDGERVNILVWRCFTTLCGGVGDRMRGIRFVFLLAVATNRLFFIDWPRRDVAPFHLTLVLSPVLVDWRFPYATMRALTRNTSIASINAIPFKRNPRRMEYVAGTQVYNVSANETDFHTLWADLNVIYFTNRMPRSSIHYLSDNPSIHLPRALDRYHIWLVKLEQMLMKVLFTPTTIVRQLVAARVPFQRGRYIAAHARTGVDVGEGKGPRLGYIATHLDEHAVRMLRCIRNVRRYADHIFLASDSADFKRSFIALTANSTARVETEFRKPFHIDRKGSGTTVKRELKKKAWLKHYALQYPNTTEEQLLVIKEQQEENLICLAFLDVFADIFALAYADAFVYYHSGFAATAEAFGAHNIAYEMLDYGPGFDMECSKWNVFNIFGKVKRSQ